MTSRSRSRSRLDLWTIVHSFRNEFFTCLFKIQNVQVIQNDVIKCCKMMSSNVALLHSNNCCVLEPAICEDLDLHVVIFWFLVHPDECKVFILWHTCISGFHHFYLLIFVWINVSLFHRGPILYRALSAIFRLDETKVSREYYPCLLGKLECYI